MELTTTTLLTVMPALVVATEAPEMKFDPVRVTFVEAPAVALLGVMEVRVGAGALMMKGTGEEAPPEVVTVTSAGPAALAAMAKVAVI